MTATTTADVPPTQSQQHDLFLRLQTIDEMVRANEEVERRLERIAERRRMPPVPDLRFEYSYLRSVSQYVHLEQRSASGKGKAKEKEEAEGEGENEDEAVLAGSEVVRVEWGRVLWITTRDQLISPLLQGALWCVLPFPPSSRPSPPLSPSLSSKTVPLTGDAAF